MRQNVLIKDLLSSNVLMWTPGFAGSEQAFECWLCTSPTMTDYNIITMIKCLMPFLVSSCLKMLATLSEIIFLSTFLNPPVNNKEIPPLILHMDHHKTHLSRALLRHVIVGRGRLENGNYKYHLFSLSNKDSKHLYATVRSPRSGCPTLWTEQLPWLSTMSPARNTNTFSFLEEFFYLTV